MLSLLRRTEHASLSGNVRLPQPYEIAVVQMPMVANRKMVHVPDRPRLREVDPDVVEGLSAPFEPDGQGRARAMRKVLGHRLRPAIIITVVVRLGVEADASPQELFVQRLNVPVLAQG